MAICMWDKTNDYNPLADSVEDSVADSGFPKLRGCPPSTQSTFRETICNLNEKKRKGRRIATAALPIDPPIEQLSETQHEQKLIRIIKIKKRSTENN